MAHTHGQHYLLSAEARSLSLMQIMRLSDEQAFDMFKEARWGKGPVACPCCGGVEHYWLKNRSQWRCKHKECGKQFSITSGTIFHSAKMPLRVYLAAIALYSNCAKGMSALQMSRDLDVQYKTSIFLRLRLSQLLRLSTNSLLIASECSKISSLSHLLYFIIKYCLTPVSYTHLTLPTILLV